MPVKRKGMRQHRDECNRPGRGGEGGKEKRGRGKEPDWIWSHLYSFSHSFNKTMNKFPGASHLALSVKDKRISIILKQNHTTIHNT